MVVLRGPYSWLLFRICRTYADWESCCFMYLMCSWYLCFRLQLVCPTYDNLNMLHVSLYIQHLPNRHGQIYQFKNIKEKLYRTNDAIWYKKPCRQKQLTPNYTSFTINGINRQCLSTVKTATHFQINQELKFLYITKQKLNTQIYKFHLECASAWHNNCQLTWSNPD
jgi:hypothetical protein